MMSAMTRHWEPSVLSDCDDTDDAVDTKLLSLWIHDLGKVMVAGVI